MASLAGVQGRRSEDWCGASPDLAVVLDGVSSPEEDGGGCSHGTPWYVQNLGLAILNYAAGARALSLPDALSESIGAVAALHYATCDLNNPGTPSATVGILRSCEATIEHLVLSDATAVLSVNGETTAVSDRRVDDVIAGDLLSVFAAPTGSTEQHKRLNAMVRKQRMRRNKPDGYWLAGAVPEAASRALTGSSLWHPGDSALLLSDGAACLVDTYARMTWADMVTEARGHGLGHLLWAVREAESEDPNGERWPRFKRSDDATALLVQPDVPGPAG